MTPTFLSLLFRVSINELPSPTPRRKGQFIRENSDIAGVIWWPRYAYHFTDITNAVNILTTCRLYSRININGMHLMKNENASRQVIDMTSPEAATYVRFYFCPLTPTQYHNEESSRCYWCKRTSGKGVP